MLRPIALSVGCLLALSCLAGPALAQSIGGMGGQGGGQGYDPAGAAGLAPTSGLSNPDTGDDGQNQQGGGDDSAAKAPLAPPPSLPGSHAQAAAVAPADRNVADLNPTEALFDAVNRGDTQSARDALSRGADTDAKNVLGQTPLDLAVDLGRNDISFLLLSLRNGTEEAIAAPTPSPRHAPVSTYRVTATAHAAAVPSAGFLGFGGG